MMGLGHIKPGLTAARNAGTGIFHPTLGVEAVGVIDDEPIWPVAGGAEDDEGDGDGGEDDDEGDGDDDDDSGDDDDADGSKAKIAALTEEKDRHYKRRKKAEQERDALKAELDALKAKQGKKPAKKAAPKAADADADADDDAEGELETERAGRRADKEASDKALRAARIENAFLRVNNIDWHRPEQVMTLMLSDDDYEVEFDGDGNIDRKSLLAELKRFAKANPHLVKPKAKTEDGEGDAGTSGKSGTSGSSMNGQRKGKGQAPPTREQLAKKYPALNNR